ncbi:MAG TPA: NAD(P)-dependent oxidoreductase [Thermoplasmata archaeon]
MRVLITGANGFIGSHLVMSLCRETDHQVVSMVRGAKGQEETRSPAPKNRIVHGDVSDMGDVSRIITETRPDAVIHLATKYAVAHQADEIGEMVNTNIKGTYNILESLRNSPSTTLINASTCYVYETSKTAVDEKGTLRPQNLYALTKVGAEEACRFFSNNYGMNTLNLRFFPPYGPGDSPKKLIQSTYRTIMDGREPILSDGTQKWDFVFVGDVVECLKRSLVRIESTEGPGFRTLNVGTAKVVEVREIVRRIFELTGKSGEPAWGTASKRKNEIEYLCCDNRALREWLGWVPTTPMIGGGLEATIEALRKEGGA